jgi:hypothetical protein
VAEVDGDRVVIRRTSGTPETIETRLRAGRLTPVAIRTVSASEHSGEHVLTFAPSLPDATTEAFGADPAGTFTLAVDAHTELVTGSIEPTAMGFTLRPGAPAWATTRVIRLTITRAGETFTIETSVGP